MKGKRAVWERCGDGEDNREKEKKSTPGKGK